MDVKRSEDSVYLEILYFKNEIFPLTNESLDLRGYIPFSGSKNQKNLYCLFLKYILLTMFLQNFIEIGALELKIRPSIARIFWNYLYSMST